MLSRFYLPSSLSSRNSSLGVAVLLLLASGCGKGDDSTHRVSGTVTFNNQPVASGKIYFNPDATKQNTGPQGYADIIDGHYDTGKTGKGTVGGAVVVRIDGFDGSGKPLFSGYETRADLPAEAVTKDFAVPASAAKTIQRSTVPPP